MRGLLPLAALLAAAFTVAPAGATDSGMLAGTVTATVPATIKYVDTAVIYLRETYGQSLQIAGVTPQSAKAVGARVAGSPTMAELVVTQLALGPGGTFTVAFRAKVPLPGIFCFAGGWWLANGNAVKMTRGDESLPQICPVL